MIVTGSKDLPDKVKKLILYNTESDFENWSKEQFQNPFG